MGVATCQFTQGAVVGGSGQSVFGFATNAVATMTDNGGAGASSYLWEIISWPSPLASAPAITNSTSQVATVTPTLDGVYIVKLTRVEAAVTTTDIKFFGVSDEDALTLPSVGQTGNMTNQSVNAQKAGWAGRQNATTNFQLDAYLRFLKARVGRYTGHTIVVNHSSGAPVVLAIVEGVSKPLRLVTMTGAGTYTEELTASANDGMRIRYRVVMTAGAGNFILKNGVAGSTILTLTAPPTATFTYEVEAVTDGTNWSITRTGTVDPKAVTKAYIAELVSGTRSTDQVTFTRIGAVTIDPSKFPTSEIRFQAEVEATTGKTVSVQLYNTTDGSFVGSPLTSTSLTPAVVEAVITLPASLKTYEALIRMTTPGDASDRVTCTNARIVLTWG